MREAYPTTLEGLVFTTGVQASSLAPRLIQARSAWLPLAKHYFLQCRESILGSIIFERVNDQINLIN